MATVALFAIKAGFTYAAGLFLQQIFASDSDSPLQRDDVGEPLDGRGNRIPYLIGRHLVTPLRGHRFGRDTIIEQNSSAGGKGVGGGQGGFDNEVFYEGSVEFLCSGVGGRLRTIEQSGKIIWPKENEFPDGITPETHPSGTRLDCRDNEGTFEIHWGFPDQAVITSSRAMNMALATRFPGIMLIVWDLKRLGGVGTFPFLKYDIEVRPYKPTYLTTSTDYFAEPSELQFSEPWLRNSVEPVEALIDNVLLYGQNPNTIKIAGFKTATYLPSPKIALRYRNLPDADLDNVGVTYNSQETVVIPQDALGTVRLYNWRMNQWVLSDATALQTTGAVPGLVTGTSTEASIWRVRTNQGGFSPDQGFIVDAPLAGSPTVPGAGNPGQLGDKVNRLSFYYRPDTPPRFAAGPFSVPSTDRFFVGIVSSGSPLSGGLVPPIPGARTGYVTLTVSSEGGLGVSYGGGASGRFFDVGGGWYRFEVDIVAGQGNSMTPTENCNVFVSTIVNLHSSVGGSNTFTPVYDRFAWVAFHSGSIPTLNVPLVRYLEGTEVTGVTTIQVRQPVSGFADFEGQVLPKAPNIEGMAGANPAHMVWQALTAPFPFGRGLPEDLFDKNVFEVAGSLFETEGLRCHLESKSASKISEGLQRLMIDVGALLNWDPVTGKHRLDVRRGSVAKLQIPRELFSEDLPDVSRSLDSSSSSRLGYSFQIADNSYRDAVVIENRSGTGLQFETDSGAQISELPSAKDAETGAALANRRLQEDRSRASLSEVVFSRDAQLLRPSDLLDVGNALGSRSTQVVVSVDSQPLEASCRAVLVEVPVSENIPTDAGVVSPYLRGADTTGGPSKNSSQGLDDVAGAIVSYSDGSIRVLRLAGSSVTRRAIASASDDGLSYWALGVVDSAEGGEIVHVDGSDVYLKQSPTSRLGEIDLKTKDTNTVLYDVFSEAGREMSLSDVEDLGDDLIRVQLLQTDPDGAPPPMILGEFLFFYPNGDSETLEAKLPSSLTPSFKVTPISRGASDQIAPASQQSPVSRP